MNYLELTKYLLKNYIEIDNPDPLSEYIIYQSGKNITYCIPASIYLDFNFTELRKTFGSFEVEYRNSKRYYTVRVQLL